MAQETLISEIIKEEPKIQNLYQHFASERDREEVRSENSEKPRAGNTIFVSGNKLTEDFLNKSFNEFGTIVNVSMEFEKGRGFVSFLKPESADRAIAEIHGKSVNGINLQVQLARRQPQIEPINDASSSAAWSSIGNLVKYAMIVLILKNFILIVAANKSQKGNHKDVREVVQYNDDLFPLSDF